MIMILILIIRCWTRWTCSPSVSPPRPPPGCTGTSSTPATSSRAASSSSISVSYRSYSSCLMTSINTWWGHDDILVVSRENKVVFNQRWAFFGVSCHSKKTSTETLAVWGWTRHPLINYTLILRLRSCMNNLVFSFQSSYINHEWCYDSSNQCMMRTWWHAVKAGFTCKMF